MTYLTDRILNIVKSHVAGMISRIPQPCMGTIASYDPATNRVKVAKQPSGQLTNWLDMCSAGIGNGWGVFTAPAIGDQVFMVPREGDSNTLVVVGRVPSATSPPPGVPAGETWLVSGNGSYIKLTENGVIATQGTWMHTGDIIATGNISDAHGSIDRLRQHYNQHTHSGVQSGAASTGTTSARDAE